jgi:FMN phosphatase YigB (HAD superfamily)
MTSPRIRALFLDFGNVCATLHFGRFIDQFARKTGVPGGLIEEVLFNGEEDGGSYSPFFSAFECGTIGPTQFFHQLTTKLGCQRRIDYHTFARLWASVFDEENEALSRLLHRVEVPKYLLSNTNLAAYTHFIADCDLVRVHMPMPDQRILSYRVGTLKPGRAIYDVAVERAGVDFTEALFVDDRAVNLQAWESLGGYSIHYNARAHHIKQLELDLHRYGVLSS